MTDEKGRMVISENFEDIVIRFGWNESEAMEFKSAKGGLPKSLWETYSAMANSQGGVILLGVEDDGSVSGVQAVDHMKKSFWDIVNNRGKVSVNILMESDVKEYAHQKGTLLAIHVPKAARQLRPVFIGQNPLTGTYRRGFEGDYH